MTIMYVKKNKIEKFFLIIALILCSCSNSSLKDDKENGIINSYYEDGTLKESIMYKNGLKDGFSITYYSTGAIKSVMNWRSNIRHGGFSKYDENGFIKETGNYYKDKLVGYVNNYYKGKLYHSRQYLLINDEEYVNQYVNYNSEGGISGNISNFYSLFDNKDTIKVNEKHELIIKLNSPIFQEGMYVVLGDYETKDFFSKIPTLEKHYSNNFKTKLSLKFSTSGEKVIKGAIINYSNKDSLKQNRVQFFEKKYMVIE